MFEDNFQVQAPRGLYPERQFKGGFFALLVWGGGGGGGGLMFGGAYTWWDLFSEFCGMFSRFCKQC